MAKQFGVNGIFGLTYETGIITDSLSWSYSNENKVLRSGDGDVNGKAYYNEQIDVSIAGYIPVTTGFSGTLASAITLVTAPADYLDGSVGSLTIAETITRTHTIEDYQRIEIGAVNHPGIT